MNGCKYIKDKYGINEEDIIITHDGVRPFINKRIIIDNIKVAKKYGAVNTVVTAIDTIVESIDGKEISAIPIRSNMYLCQTPQTFNMKKFIYIMNSLTEEEKNSLTDACKAFIIKGEKVEIVKGEYTNIKITTKCDLEIANTILKKTNN